MKIKHLFLFLLISVFSCEMTENPDVRLSLEEELKKVMALPLSLPEGKVHRVEFYIGDSESIHSTREILYPTKGNIALSFFKNYKQDTVEIGLNYFNGKVLETSHLFNFEQGKAVWQSTREYQYLWENRIDKIFHTSAAKERSLLAQYHYNSQNLLTQIEYPFINGAELQVYEYDTSGRISKEWNTAKGQEEFKIDYLVYRYNEGLLVAKETGRMGSVSDDRQDAFQYFHDAKGRVISQKEFDPYFGFQQKGRSELFYIGSNNK